MYHTGFCLARFVANTSSTRPPPLSRNSVGLRAGVVLLEVAELPVNTAWHGHHIMDVKHILDILPILDCRLFTYLLLCISY